MSAWAPQHCMAVPPAGAAPVAHPAHTQLSQELGQGHVCSRFCVYGQQFGNVYKCSTSGQLHVCDHNCDQRVSYDRYSTICRLSKKIFQRSPADVDMDMQAASRKRCAEAGTDYLGANKRAITSP